MNSSSCRFSSGLALSNLVVSSDLLHRSLKAISDLKNNTHFHHVNVNHKVYQSSSNVPIIAFACSSDFSVHHLQNGGMDMVSSEELKGSFDLFDFVSTKVNPSFSISKEAVTLFSSIQHDLSALKQQYDSSRSLIITGHSLGGAIASLFTLWLLDSISWKKETKPPLCISFGSPLLGDNAFQRAVAERPKWKPCFLHVVSVQDPITKCFISSDDTLASGSTSRVCVYKPFGSFLLCSETGCTCLDEPESICEVMTAVISSSVGNQHPNECFQIIDYKRLLDCLNTNTIRRSPTQLAQSAISNGFRRRNFVTNPLQAEIFLQLKAIGVERLQDNDFIDSLITNIEERVERLSLRKTNTSTKKRLNDMKINMAYLEWYKKVTFDQGAYYDSYKKTSSRTRDEIKSRAEITKRKSILTQYWKNMVAEADKMPQKEGAAFRKSWLFAGTNYRRMIEPLDIADYYVRGGRDYITRGRSGHYVLLEQWWSADISASFAKERRKATSLTEDSCFWAHVEEAIISCRVLKDDQSNPESKDSAMANLIKFEEYVMGQINYYAVSPEIFNPGSSFMNWSSEYYDIMGASYDSPLCEYMRNCDYHQYA